MCWIYSVKHQSHFFSDIVYDCVCLSSYVLDLLSSAVDNAGVVRLEGHLHICCHDTIPGCLDCYLVICQQIQHIGNRMFQRVKSIQSIWSSTNVWNYSDIFVPSPISCVEPLCFGAWVVFLAMHLTSQRQLTKFVWCDISLVSTGILVKLATDVRRVSGKNWKGF